MKLMIFSQKSIIFNKKSHITIFDSCCNYEAALDEFGQKTSSVRKLLEVIGSLKLI